MIHIPYRIRQGIKRVLLALLILMALAAAVGIFWFAWLQRFVIYTRDQGVVIDLHLSGTFPEGEIATPDIKETVPIQFETPEDDPITSVERTQLLGFYADKEMLRTRMDMVMRQVDVLEEGAPVMLDVKDGKGRFFYSSAIYADRNSGVDNVAMDALIEKLKEKDVYLIARLPAFRDFHFGLTSTSNGLFVASGEYLWADADYCYWLDPTRDGTLMYLIEIVNELKELGFDEVVFDEFRFPDVDPEVLKFSKDRLQSLNNAAKTLMSACATDDFAVSFMYQVDGLVLPKGNGRLYFANVAAVDIEKTVQKAGVDNPVMNLVFLTPYLDTRFNAYSVLRPIESAEAKE